jgi:hypothetical protein
MLTNDYQHLAVGCRVRLGPLTVGSNNLTAFLGSNRTYGTSAYCELTLQCPARSKDATK